jgi:diguanylate cyclase (GGDEF)-like protein
VTAEREPIPMTERENTAVRYRRIFEVLASISNTIAQGVDLDPLIALIARETLGLVSADSCSVMLLDEHRTELLCRAACGLSPDEQRGITFRVGEGVAGWVAARGEPARIDDVASDDRFVHKSAQSLRIHALLCVPLKVRDTVVGVITVTRADPKSFTQEDQEILSFLANAVVLDVENARLYRLSVTDPLTKAYNRQYLRERIPDEIDRGRRFGHPLSVLLFDVDHFKTVNDTHGHDAGDDVLRAIAETVRENLRHFDTLARYGGEEFVVVLPNTDTPEGVKTAERLRTQIESLDIATAGRSLRVTASFGVATLTTDMREESELLRAADEALYAAKRSGRNRTEIAPGTSQCPPSP